VGQGRPQPVMVVWRGLPDETGGDQADQDPAGRALVQPGLPAQLPEGGTAGRLAEDMQQSARPVN
jgi:hypothetical protein